MINKKSASLLFVLTVSLLGNISAKENDFCSWIDLAAIKKIHSASFGLTGEFRTMQNNSAIERYGVGIKGDYSIFRWLSAGGGFVLAKYKQTDHYERKNRYYFQLEPNFHLSKLLFDFRERIQVTQSPESQINLPANKLWRNRIETCYKNGSWKMEPLLSLESLYLLENQSKRKFTEFRYQIGAYYHATTSHKIKFYGMLTESSFLSRFVIGVNWEFKL